MKKKYLFVIGGSYVSGLEIVTLHLIKELKENGNQIRCVISGWNDGVFKNKLKELDVPFDEVKLGWVYISKPLWTLDTLIHWPAAYLAYKKILKNFNPDICHFCSYSTVLMLFPLLKNRNCVYNLQEPHAPTRKHLLIYRLLNKRIKIFTAVSQHIVQVLLALKIPREKIRLIYNGVPVLPGDVGQHSPGSPVIFAIIGQVVSWKGHETLIDAVDILVNSSCKNFVVYIFGNDKNEYAGSLQKKIKNKSLESYFVWKGFVEKQDDIYRQVDVVIVPSLSQEPCSLTILESLMRGKAVVASDRGGNIELIDHERNGFIFTATDAGALASCMSLLLKNEQLISAVGNNGHIQALQKYTATRMREGYDKVYMEVVLGNWNI